MVTRRVTWIVGTAVGIALLSSSVAPAAAEEPFDVLLSSDGIVFSSAPTRGILDPLVTLVPGGSLASVLWIRNPATTRAIVRVSAIGLSIPSASFAEDVSLTTTVSQGSETRSRTLAQLSECEMLVPSRVMEGGATMRLDLGFAMSADARNVSQSQRASLSVLVALHDADAGAFEASPCDEPGPIVGPQPAVPALPAAPAGAGPTAGALASTGADLPVPLIAIGALLFGVGFFLLGARRRAREES
ncbi:MAG: hypothetical protein LH605_10525 [Microbacteriaceae bacterium]|nr:hypothetical protein [Microbacteriaceae bacterium]